MTTRTRSFADCVDCGRRMIVRARRLCHTCHDRAAREGTLDRYPCQRRQSFNGRRLADFAEDYQTLRERGLSHAEIARRMGYRPRSVGRLCTRARQAGLLNGMVS